LTVYNDGSGPALYVGGAFTTAGGAPAANIAKWDGSHWSALGSGASSSIAALAVYEDQGQSWLFAGGEFTYIGGLFNANHVAKWNGTRWATVSTGTDQSVYALTVYDDGHGSALYAGGYFTMAGGRQASRIAKWDGFGWFALGDGLDGDYPHIKGLTTFDDGSGLSLYGVGHFSLAGGASANNIAKWDGTSWSPLGEGLGSYETPVVKGYRDVNAAGLYVGGRFSVAGTRASSRIAEWRCPIP